MSKYYYNDKNAPKPNTLHIGSVVAIWHDERVLLDHRRDGMWSLVGGAMELGESLETCVRRETMEETGLELNTLKLLGTFSHASRIIERPDTTLQSVTICFTANSTSEELHISDESRSMAFLAQEEIENLQLALLIK